MAYGQPSWQPVTDGAEWHVPVPAFPKGGYDAAEGPFRHGQSMAFTLQKSRFGHAHRPLIGRQGSRGPLLRHGLASSGHIISYTQTVPVSAERSAPSLAGCAISYIQTVVI